MREKVEKLIAEFRGEYDKEVQAWVKGGRKGDFPSSGHYLGSAIQGLNTARDNLAWREEALKEESSKVQAPSPK